MAKMFVNGYDDFIVLAVRGNEGKQFNFSCWFEALEEYFEQVATVDEWDDGSKRKIHHYYRYEWVISYEGRINSPDLLMWAEVETLENEGWQLYLIPHKDIIDRIFAVIIKPENRKIGMLPHFNGEDSTFNRGIIMTLQNKEPITQINMIDPNTYLAGLGGTTDPEGPVEGQLQS